MTKKPQGAKGSRMTAMLAGLNLPEQDVLRLARYGIIYVGDLGYTSKEQRSRMDGISDTVEEELSVVFKSALVEECGRGLTPFGVKAEYRRIRPQPLPEWMERA